MKWRTWIGGLGLVVLTGLATAQTPTGAVSPAVAVVDSVTISQAEVDAVVEMSEPIPAGPSPSQIRQARMRALSMLIDNVLMRKFLDTKVHPVPAEEIQRRVVEMEAGLRDQTPRRSLAEFCQERNRTPDQLKEEIADHLRWGVYAASKLTAEELTRFYQKNKDYFAGVKVRASHIVLRLAPEPLEEDRERYAPWKRSLDEAKANLEKLRGEILADPKADFAEYAQKYSQDPQGKSGGDLGLIEWKWFDEEFSRAAFALRVGEVSGVVKTPYGVHLIKVTERPSTNAIDFARIRETVREFRTEELRQEVLAEQRKGSKIQILLP